MNGVHDLLDRPVVRADPLFQFGQLLRQLTMRRQHLSEPDERANDKNAGLDGPSAVEDVGGHDRAVFREGVR